MSLPPSSHHGSQATSAQPRDVGDSISYADTLLVTCDHVYEVQESLPFDDDEPAAKRAKVETRATAEERIALQLAQGESRIDSARASASSAAPAAPALIANTELLPQRAERVLNVQSMLEGAREFLIDGLMGAQTTSSEDWLRTCVGLAEMDRLLLSYL